MIVARGFGRISSFRPLVDDMKKIIAVFAASGFIFLVLFLLKVFRVTENLLLLSLIGAGLFLLGAIVLKLLMPRVRATRFFSFKPMGFLEWRLTACLALLLICGSFLLNYLTSLFYGVLSVDVPAAFSGSGYSSIGTAILCIAVLPAVFEEIFFRGAVLTMLRTSKMKTMVVMVFSAVLFTLLHGPSWYFLTDFYAGMLLAFLVYVTGSVYSAIAAHFISNFVSFFLALYGGRLVDAGIGDLTIHAVVVCFLGVLCHLLHLLKKTALRHDASDRSRINENSRRWEEKMSKGEK